MSIFNKPEELIVQGHQIRYYTGGSGVPLVFVHGITTYSFIWKKVYPYFQDSFQVFLPDLLGCGDSAIPLNEDISLKRQATVLYDFCQALGLSKIHLVCHDVGGGVGQIFAAAHPEFLIDLTLINSVAYNFWPVQPIIAIRTPIIRQIAMATLDMGMFEVIIKRGLYHKSHLTAELMEQFWRPLKTTLGRKGFLHFARCLDNNNLIEIDEALKHLNVSTLIVRGDADVYLPTAICEKLHATIPNSKLVMIATGGHFIQEDEPELLAKTILNFFEQAV
jgi:pimeloyl-ACP methyl ester carboxylesterase